MAVTTYKLTCRFGASLKTEIDRYAEKRGIVFAEAVRELCERALTYDFDAGYAPQIGRIVERSVRASDMRTEALVTYSVDLLLGELRDAEERLTALICDEFE